MHNIIRDLRDRKLAIQHNHAGVSENLRRILNQAFPESSQTCMGGWDYYYTFSPNSKEWDYSDILPHNITTITTDEAYDQLFPEKKLMGYKLNGKITAKEVATLLWCTTELNSKGLFFWGPNLNGASFSRAKQLGILDLWFDAVYEEDKPTKAELTLECGKTIKICKYNGFSFEGSVLSKEKLDYILLPFKRVNGYDIHAQSWTIGCLKFTREDVLRGLKLFNKL